MAARKLTAPLETRGPGVVGKWEEQWFELEDEALESFALDRKRPNEPLRRIAMQDIRGLVLEGSRECSFEAAGLKVRLRARSEQEMQDWFAALQVTQAPPTDVKSPDVFVKIAGIFGLPRQPTAEEHKWYAVATWQNHDTRQTKCLGRLVDNCCSGLPDRQWTRETAAQPSVSPQTEECHLKQTLQLKSMAGTRTLLLSVFRVAVGFGGSHKFGDCMLDADDSGNQKLKDHPIASVDGRSTGASMRLRVRLTNQAAPTPATPPSARAGHKLSPRLEALAVARTADHAPLREQHLEHGPVPGVVPSSGSHPARMVQSCEQVTYGTHPVPLQPADNRPGDSPKEAPRKPWAKQPAAAHEQRRSPNGTPVSSQGSPISDRARHLYGLHEAKQRKLEMKRATVELESHQRLQETREAYMRRSRRAWSAAELRPQEAAQRLFMEHETRKRDLAVLRQHYEEKERQELEEQRFHKKGMVRSSSAPSRSTMRQSCERLHKDHERRSKERLKRREQYEAVDLEKLEKSSVGPYKRCLSARGETRRHEELYEYARVQREVCDRRRREHEEKEMQKYNEALLTTRSGPFDDRHIDGLFRDHQEREQRRAFRRAELQAREQEEVAVQQRRKPSPRGARRGVVQVTAAVELLNVDHAALIAEPAALQQFEAAVAGAVAHEAGNGILPENVHVVFSEGSMATKSVMVQAAIGIPSKGVASSVHAALSSTRSLGASVVGRLANLDYVGTEVSQRKSLSATESPGHITVSDRGVTVAKLQGPDRQRSVPIWRRTYGPSRKDDVHEPASVNPTVADLATQNELVLSTVVSAIHLRCFCERTSSAAELKPLRAPLKNAMSIYKDALNICEKADGFLKLSSTPSQRLFHDGLLLPEDEGWRFCVEPSPIRQVEEDLDLLLEVAARAQMQLGELLAPGPVPGTPWEPGTARAKPSGVPAAMMAVNPGVKSWGAAARKAFVRYQASERGQSYRHLLDLARFGLVFPNSYMLQKGLDSIIKKFEVLHVRNYYHTPGRLGHRMVEVHLCIEVDDGREGTAPHVCELRLEEAAFERAREEAAPHLEQFLDRLCSLFAHGHKDVGAMAYFAQSLLAEPSESHALRVFRRRLAQTCGSTIGGWRRSFGGGRQLSFGRFRDVCHLLNCRREAPEHWSQLDVGLSGCISLYELDPDAVQLLLHIRARMLGMLQSDEQDLFGRLTLHIQLTKPGQLDVGEFRQVLRSLGFSATTADRAFTYLDYEGGNRLNPPARVSAADIAWLVRLSQLVDVDAVLLNASAKLRDVESMRHLVTLKAHACKTVLAGGLAPTPSAPRNSTLATPEVPMSLGGTDHGSQLRSSRMQSRRRSSSLETPSRDSGSRRSSSVGPTVSQGPAAARGRDPALGTTEQMPEQQEDDDVEESF